MTEVAWFAAGFGSFPLLMLIATVIGRSIGRHSNND